MRCPVCKIDMIVVEYESIELDYCTKCQGVWFDSGELELLLHNMKIEGSGLSLSGIYESPEAPSAEKQRRCPVCRRKMNKSTLGERPGVLVDICPRGEGLWLDGGEVGQLVAQQPAAEPGSKERVLGFLGRVFQGRG